MKRFKEISININSVEMGELIIASITDLDFEGIEEAEKQLNIFIDENKFDEQKLKELLFPHDLEYTLRTVENKNWNEEWEWGFEPVIIDNKVVIRADFHKPLIGIPYEVIITPKMSFGTGHHATTRLMIRQMGLIDFVDKSVLDFGTGTGVLAILAKKFGARIVTATDHDEWSIKNARENVINNFCEVNIINANNIDVNGLGRFDIILANINLNVLTSNARALAKVCQSGGFLLLSGFYENNANELKQYFDEDSFNIIVIHALNDWCCIMFQAK